MSTQPGNGKGNGVEGPLGKQGAKAPPPAFIADLAEGCVRHVERSIGVKLDYQPETLSILDHYIGQARAEARAKPEVLSVLAQTAGAYLGEVVRRRYPSWWRTEGSDPAEWRLELEAVYLAFSPMRLILEAVLRVAPAEAPRPGAVDAAREASRAGEEGTSALSLNEGDEVNGRADEEERESEVALLDLEEEDHAAVAARLAELPPVSEEEFYAPSTRVEVIDIAIEAIRARRMAAGEQVDVELRPEDYDQPE